MIHTEHNGRIHVLFTRRRDNDLFRTTQQVLAGLLLAGKQSGGFMYYINTVRWCPFLGHGSQWGDDDKAHILKSKKYSLQ